MYFKDLILMVLVLIPGLEDVNIKKPKIENEGKYRVLYGDTIESVDLEIDARRQLKKSERSKLGYGNSRKNNRHQ